MIYLIIGTKAQLIKMAPIMVELERRAVPYAYYSTGQHQETMDEIHQEFGVRGPDAFLVQSRDAVTVIGLVKWLAHLLGKMVFRDKKLFPDAENSVVFVHGDTLSTLVGTLVGRRNKCRVGHVESGLRSEHLFSPFPEEITRRMVFRLADILFCPGNWAVSNLLFQNKTIVNTCGNTLMDALALALHNQQEHPVPNSLDDEEFGVMSIHRTENLISRSRVSRFVKILEDIAEKYPLLLVMHKTTRRALQRGGFLNRIERNPRIHTSQRLSYFRFIAVLDRCAFVISDGGSNQEECFYLGKPVLLLRKSTERVEGVGENCMVGGYDKANIRVFIERFRDYAYGRQIGGVSPSSIIVNEIAGVDNHSG